MSASTAAEAQEDVHSQIGVASGADSGCATRATNSKRHAIQPRRADADHRQPCGKATIGVLGAAGVEVAPWRTVQRTPFDRFLSFAADKRPKRGNSTTYHSAPIRRLFPFPPIVVEAEIVASAGCSITVGSAPTLDVSLSRAGELSVSASDFQLDDSQLFGIAEWLSKHLAVGMIVPAVHGRGSAGTTTLHGEVPDNARLFIGGQFLAYKAKNCEFTVSAKFEHGILSIEEETKITLPLSLRNIAATLEYSIIVKLTPLPPRPGIPVVDPRTVVGVEAVAWALALTVRQVLILLPSSVQGGWFGPAPAYS